MISLFDNEAEGDDHWLYQLSLKIWLKSFPIWWIHFQNYNKLYTTFNTDMLRTNVLGSIHTCEFLGIYDSVNYCVNYFKHCNRNSSQLKNPRCECYFRVHLHRAKTKENQRRNDKHKMEISFSLDVKWSLR